MPRTALAFLLVALAGCAVAPPTEPSLDAPVRQGLFHEGHDLGWVDVRVGLTPGATLEDLNLHVRASFANRAARPVASLLVSGNNESGVWNGWGSASSPHGPDHEGMHAGFVRVFANGQPSTISLPAAPYAPRIPPPTDGPSEWNIDVGEELRRALSYINQIGGDTVAHLVFVMVGADPRSSFQISGNWTETPVALTYGHGNDTFRYMRRDIQPTHGASASFSEVQAHVGTDLRLSTTLGTADNGVVFMFEGRTNAGGVFGSPPVGDAWYTRPNGERVTGSFSIEVSPFGGDWTFGLDNQSNLVGADSGSVVGAIIKPAYLG